MWKPIYSEASKLGRMLETYSFLILSNSAVGNVGEYFEFCSVLPVFVLLMAFHPSVINCPYLFLSQTNKGVI